MSLGTNVSRWSLRIAAFFAVPLFVACAPHHDEVRARAAIDLDCHGQPIATSYFGEERYSARGCGKAAVFRCKNRIADDRTSCTIEEGSLVVGDTAAPPAPLAMTPAPAAAATAPAAPEPIDREASCRSAEDYDRRVATAVSPAREQLAKIAARKHKECESPSAAPSPSAAQ
jgi:hypothetical protein